MTFDDFRARARPGHLVPVAAEILLDATTPVAAFAALRKPPFAFLLESAPAGGETWARYTFLGTEPRGAWRFTDGVAEDWSPERGWHGRRTSDDPFADLRARLTAFTPVAAPEHGPFWTGAVGYFSYDMARYIERLPSAPPRGVAAPDALWVFTDIVVVIDNLRGTAKVVAAVPVDTADDAALRTLFDGATARVQAVVERLRAPSRLRSLSYDAGAPPVTGVSTYERAKFMADVDRIKDYIVAGDCFQALLARRIRVPHDFDATALYRILRSINPSPYMYHLELDGVEIVGSSPELLVRVQNDTVTVRPIAGTRPRGATAAEDERLVEELLADAKERAEHVMLVDLGRNDIGRIAKFGTVRVTDLMRVERYSHVFHITSQVEGTLPPGGSALEVFRAVFPAGTMTGAPKVRAMEIIDELEPERRGPYAGALGYISADDAHTDLAITIRTCVMSGGEASVQAGAGIVHDSVPEKEWDETESKARAMLTAIGRARTAKSE
ncbi:MAG TPA: anthranilate synthase component I family protein [Gemmatimonadaceae bacterium]|nr:anthranilate synthase component I family protein [Gemmatimonadaceae bacterium]